MKFSVLLPTRNRIDLLRYAVESVRRQDYPDWEIIISDNDSEDDIAGYVQSLHDTRIRYVRTSSFVPVTENWNNALRHAKGDYVLMLGDDDAIMSGYFRKCVDLISRHNSPEVIYTNAYQFAYPNVIPGKSSAYLQIGYTEFFYDRDLNNPFWLSKNEAYELVRKSMSFRLAFGFNMQHYLVSRKMVEELSKTGSFYQSPYPDYYAANALLLHADRILAVPEPMVVIGISPKSFGFYYFNNQEAAGDDFLKNMAEPELAQRLAQIVLPGTSMNSSWLYAMELLKNNFKHIGALRVDYARYRFLQIHATYRLAGVKGVRELLPMLHFTELLKGVFWGVYFAAVRMVPIARIKQTMAAWGLNSIRTNPIFDPRIREVRYQNILEMVESESGAEKRTGEMTI